MPLRERKVYRRCCYPRTFPDFSQPNAGSEPHLDRAATKRAYKRLAALPMPSGTTIDTVDVGRAVVECAPLPSDNDSLPGTLAPPTPRQIEAKYDWIREGNPDGVTEVVVTYSYSDMFSMAEARVAFDADEQFLLAAGRTASVLDLYRGMSVVMADGTVGTILGHPERRYDMPIPPLQVDGGRWTSRVVGRVKHTAHEVIEFRWGGQMVRVTPGHEVWSADRRGWVLAYELRRGELIRVSGSEAAPAESIRRVPGLVVVYGIEVEYFHNYFVGAGDGAMLVHNGPAYIKKPADGTTSNIPRPRHVPKDATGKPRPLPRTEDGHPDPRSPNPHSQIGWQEGRKGGYIQTREFGEGGVHVKTVDWTDHGRPGQHTDPHVHDSLPNPTGGTPQHSPPRAPHPGELGGI